MVVTLAVVFAGCAGLGAGDRSAATGGGAPEQQGMSGGGDGGAPAPEEQQQRQSGGGGSGDGGEPSFAAARTNRSLIRTGTVSLEVENFTDARARLTADVRARGGYVSGSDVNRNRAGNRSWQTGYVVVRVPAENFSGMVETARKRGTVLSAKTETRDVTEQLVDIEARLANLQRQRDRLRTLYDRANTTGDLLQIQEQLTQVQGDIERLEAQKRSLRGKVSFSTLRLELSEPRPEAADDGPTPFHAQSLGGAFGRSVEGALQFGRALLVAGVAAVPWLFVVGLPVAVVVGIGRRVGRPDWLPLVGRSRKPSIPGRSGESDETRADEPDGDGYASADDRDE